MYYLDKELEQLEEDLDKGFITQEEFRQTQREIIWEAKDRFQEDMEKEYQSRFGY